jgi:broad specificity phosphatase PhoE
MTSPGARDVVTTVYLIRHGRTVLNAAGWVRGRSDPPLDEVGHGEAARLARLFASAKLDAVLTSPLQRAVQTATPLAASANAPLQRAVAFLDRDYGPWNGRPRIEVEHRYGSLDMAPGVEPQPALERRVLAGLGEAAVAYAGRSVAIVAHDAVNRALLAAVDGRSATLSWCPSGPAAGTGSGRPAAPGVSSSSTPYPATATTPIDPINGAPRCSPSMLGLGQPAAVLMPGCGRRR